MKVIPCVSRSVLAGIKYSSVPLFMVVVLTGCSPVVTSENVKTFSDHELCASLGVMEFESDNDGKDLLVREIKEREIPRGECEDTADDQLFSLRNKDKNRLCQQLGKYYHQGASEKYYTILRQAEEKGYYDDQCVDIAEFYFRRVERQREAREDRRERIRAAGQVLSQMNRPGTYGNPIHVRID